MRLRSRTAFSKLNVSRRAGFFIWHDPNQKHDLIFFIGEAQPPLGKFQFCRSLIESAKGWGVGSAC